MDKQQIRRRLDEQDWECVYKGCVYAESGNRIEPGEEIAMAYDGHGICHLKCVGIGKAPERNG